MIDNTKSDIAEDTWRNRQIKCNLEITANVGMVLVGETWNFRNLLMSIYITFTHENFGYYSGLLRQEWGTLSKIYMAKSCLNIKLLKFNAYSFKIDQY